MKSKILWRILLSAIVAAASVAAWRSWRATQKAPLPEGIVFGNGRIESIQVDVAAKYGGRIKEILAREGDLVEEGQVLVKMDTDELEAEFENDKAKLAESEQAAAEVKTEITKDESQPNLADGEFKRSESQFEGKVVAREEYDPYRTRLETAKASLEGSKAKVTIGADARIVLDARPEYAVQAKVSYVFPEAQFTPKQVETRSERDKLMFRIKLQVPTELVLPSIERITTGVRGMGYVRLDDKVVWPTFLEPRFPVNP